MLALLVGGPAGGVGDMIRCQDPRPNLCMDCGYAMTHTVGPRSPKPGDYSLCGECGRLYVRDAEQWRCAQSEDITRMPPALYFEALLASAAIRAKPRQTQTMQ